MACRRMVLVCGVSILAIGVVVACWVAPIIPSTVHVAGEVPVAHNVPVGEILSGSTVTDVIHTSWPGVREVGVLFATYARINRCTVHIGVTGGASPANIMTGLGSVAFSCAAVRDNTFVNVPLAPNPYEWYRISVSSNGRPGNAVTFWTVPLRVAAEAKLWMSVGPVTVGTRTLGQYPILRISYGIVRISVVEYIRRVSVDAWRAWGWG